MDTGRQSSSKHLTAQGNSILISILQNRRLTLLLFAAAVVHLGFSAVGISIWQCPLRLFTGLECPGCGLSTATLCLLSGNWHLALETHTLAPVVIVGLLLLGANSIAPNGYHQKLLRWVAVDRKVKLIPLVVAIAFIYWGVRIFL